MADAARICSSYFMAMVSMVVEMEVEMETDERRRRRRERREERRGSVRQKGDRTQSMQEILALALLRKAVAALPTCDVSELAHESLKYRAGLYEGFFRITVYRGLLSYIQHMKHPQFHCQYP